jgi:hypothetical protein
MTVATEIDYDLTINHIEHRVVGGVWVFGCVDGYRFEALVFGGHSINDGDELGKSGIAKLCVQRVRGREIVFNFDRGLDSPAADSEVQQVVDFLSGGLSAAIYE